MTQQRPATPIKLYAFSLSGHSHRAELFLSLLGLPMERVEVDLPRGAHKQPGFLRLNSFGQVPVLDDNGIVIADSNAILVYLAKKYGEAHWLPADPVGAARVERWLTVAAGLGAFGPAAARAITLFGRAFDAAEVQTRAHRMLEVFEAELQSQPYLCGALPAIADIANYTYIAHAPEGNVSLQTYPHVRAWLARIEQLPGFVAMPKSPVGCAA